MTRRSRVPLRGSELLIQVLGTVAITDSGAAVALPGAIPARILALLTTNLDSGLRRDALIDGVWGDAARDAATPTLQSHVARLRRVMGPDRLVTTAYGYRLALPPSALDAHQFAAAAPMVRPCCRGRPDEAAVVLREALALWRGEAYDGLDDCEPLARSGPGWASCGSTRCSIASRPTWQARPGRPDDGDRGARWRPPHARATLDIADAGLAGGRRHRGRAGRLRQGPARLLDELGLEPGAALRATQAALLRSDDAASPPDRPGVGSAARSRSSL